MSTSLQCVLRSDVVRLYRRISKRLAVETTSLYCSCFITPSHHSCSLAWPDPRRKREGLATPDYRSCSSLLKSTHAISIDFAEMHADHIVSSGSPHNNVLHFSSYTMECSYVITSVFYNNWTAGVTTVMYNSKLKWEGYCPLFRSMGRRVPGSFAHDDLYLIAYKYAHGG